MLAHIRSVWFSVNASYWFYPAIFAVSSFFLATLMVHFDRIGAADWIAEISVLNPARPDGASNMLTVLAGSMIGVASTVFSITIAAVAYASGTYGPRLLTNFMEDKGNQLSLATFIGTFVYSITVLRTVRAEDEAPLFAAQADTAPGFVPQLALLTGFGLMAIAVAVLVYFLHHIPSSIRINAVLEGIGRGLLKLIKERYEDNTSTSVMSDAAPDGAAIRASKAGYVRYIDFGSLADVAASADTRIGLAVRPGDFLQHGSLVARIERDESDDDLDENVLACFALGGSRTPEQDLEFSIDELVEIALRALSPGINDPFTAITAMHWLSAATSRLGNMNLIQKGLAKDDKAVRVIPLDDDFGHFVARGFGAVRSAAASSKLAALVAFDRLAEIADSLDDESRAALVEREAGLLMAQAEIALEGPELNEVKARYIARFQSPES